MCVHFYRGEFSVIKKIVQEIMGNMQPGGMEDNLIGIESHIEALNPLLSMQTTEEVHIIRIYGMGGIGKTTIAQALFRRISFKYEGSSFVKNVREQSSSKKDICALQEKILTDVLGTNLKFVIQDPEYGANVIQERLCNRKVLIVLDDINDVRQLEFLAASDNWFGAGCVITTRDEHILSDANAKYKPALLRMDQALELFSRHAFRKNNPSEGYKDLSNRAICYTGRLPLALKILGSFFRGREVGVWASALDRLAKLPNSEVFETLKLSFDDLNEFEQKILLDIACFFKGREVKDVTRILDTFGFHPVIGITVLIEKSLITVSKERISMHDLIQEMCLQIVRESFTNSRLRNLEEVHELVVKKGAQELIEAIVVPKEYNQDQIKGFRSNVFKQMNNLRLLDVNDKFTFDEPSFLPNNLRWITWNHYPFSSLPILHKSKLVGLEMEYAKIQHLWKGTKIMPNLKFIHLKNLDCLTRFPDVLEAPNIERLILSQCDNLVEVHESVGFLKRLIHLGMNHCMKLNRLPSRMETKSLDTLELINCSSLETIPEFSPCVIKLSSLDIYNCSKIEKLPLSIRYLSNLSFLNLDHCNSLENIPSSICELKCLKSIRLHGCSKLQNWPHQFSSMISLQELKLGDTESFNFRDLTSLFSLRKLDLISNQIREEDFPRNLDGFLSLEELRLSFNSKLIWLFGCDKLLEDEQNQSYFDNMLKQSFMKKWAAVDRCSSIGIPGICGVFKELTRFFPLNIVFRFENYEMITPKLDADDHEIDASSATENGNVWINYIPFTSFEQMHDDYNEFQREDWSHIIEGDLVIYFSTFGQKALRCGAHVVYKEDVESIQQSKSSFSSSYWNWKLVQWSANTIWCMY
ncbi:hypothetical protein R6Q57_011089 [Mikania cordata]